MAGLLGRLGRAVRVGRVAAAAVTVGAGAVASTALLEGKAEEPAAAPGGAAPADGGEPEGFFSSLQRQVTDFVKDFTEPAYEQLLPDPLPAPYQRPLTLVLDLDKILTFTEWDVSAAGGAGVCVCARVR